MSSGSDSGPFSIRKKGTNQGPTSSYGSVMPVETLIESLKFYFPTFFGTPEGEQAIQKFKERREREQHLLTMGSKGRKSFGNGL